jgi:hypothetical protein
MEGLGATINFHELVKRLDLPIASGAYDGVMTEGFEPLIHFPFL